MDRGPWRAAVFILDRMALVFFENPTKTLKFYISYGGWWWNDKTQIEYLMIKNQAPWNWGWSFFEAPIPPACRSFCWTFLELRNLNHLRKLFDLEPVANTWQAGMVKMTVHGAGVIYVFSGHCCSIFGNTWIKCTNTQLMVIRCHTIKYKPAPSKGCQLILKECWIDIL